MRVSDRDLVRGIRR